LSIEERHLPEKLAWTQGRDMRTGARRIYPTTHDNEKLAADLALASENLRGRYSH
jgi:hypothetical protein